MNDYVANFKLLPTSIVIDFDDPNDQIPMLNKLITDCIADHAPIKKVKFTRPPARWMKNPELVTAKKHLEHLQSLKNANEIESNELSDYRKSKVRYKKLTKSTELKKTYGSLECMGRTINPPKNRIRQNTSDLSKIRDPYSNAFTINYSTFDEVQKIILNLRNDCSSGHDNIPVKSLTPVVDQITSPIVHIINTSVDKETFRESWKVARVCPIPKRDNPVTVRLSTNIYFTCFIQSI